MRANPAKLSSEKIAETEGHQIFTQPICKPVHQSGLDTEWIEINGLSNVLIERSMNNTNLPRP